MEVKISIKKVTKILLGITLGLAALHILFWSLSVYGGMEGVFGFLKYFDLDSEMNIPTIFSFLLLCSFLLFLAGFIKNKIDRSSKAYWIFLGIVLFYIAIDEMIQIHEPLGLPFKIPPCLSGVLCFSWVVYGVIFVLVVFMLIFKWLMRLPKNTRNRFIAAGALYVLGALVFEIIGGYYSSLPSSNMFVFKMITLIEEIMEMTGLIIFIRALLLYIKEVLLTDKVSFILK